MTRNEWKIYAILLLTITTPHTPSPLPLFNYRTVIMLNSVRLMLAWGLNEKTTQCKINAVSKSEKKTKNETKHF